MAPYSFSPQILIKMSSSVPKTMLCYSYTTKSVQGDHDVFMTSVACGNRGSMLVSK